MASWQDALVRYAKTKDPRALPPEVLLLHTDHTLTIWDKYPKARFHYLTLPRLPFVESASKTEFSEATLANLAALIANEHGLAVLKVLKDASLEVVETIEEEMLKKYGFVWPVSVGFHAVESMAHVHLHSISQDFLSDSLKNKKHWNSFNPLGGFFLHLDDVMDWVEKGTLKKHNRSKSSYEKILTNPLKCFRCDDTFSTIPKLKEHLQDHFTELKEEAVKRHKAASGKRGAEEANDSSAVQGEKENDAAKRKKRL
ncbi:MAG: hypothetical protein CYPHOPRED_001452 [Cyphobasidiales sp. Tagirdzhanova-0007]|nr:MAG: hypothetical protein CYPHOPRED_001452 [Cyphobasidiales sp. Tagirdzhanova-0007]